MDYSRLGRNSHGTTNTCLISQPTPFFFQCTNAAAKEGIKSYFVQVRTCFWIFMYYLYFMIGKYISHFRLLFTDSITIIWALKRKIRLGTYSHLLTKQYSSAAWHRGWGLKLDTKAHENFRVQCTLFQYENGLQTSYWRDGGDTMF